MQEETLVKSLIRLKQEFAKSYAGNAHIQEVIPCVTSEQFPLEESHLRLLHEFAKKNPIYFNSFEQSITGILCMVYEGDINEHWLNSIKHGSSCQPFYPTWIMSAYVMALIAKRLEYAELIDVGSGDGRIAFCGKILGLDSYSIEIDDGLVQLQEQICSDINLDFNPICSDASEVKYSHLDLGHPVFFIGGLAQMGGDVLAASIIDKIDSILEPRNNVGMVFAGTNSKRQLSGNLTHGGWGMLIKKHDLDVVKTVSLPTVWTFDQSVETPYIFTRFRI